MLDWLRDFTDRWAGRVGQDVRDLVHWSVHALAGVVYAVFGRVGAAWHVLYDWFAYVETHIGRYLADVTDWITQIVRRDLPWLWHVLLSDVRGLAGLAGRLYQLALAAVRSALAAALRAVDDALAWVVTHVWAPLRAAIDQTYSDLLKWGYASWQLLTHPDQLAAILLDALIAAAEAAFWRIAGPAGRFILGVLLHNARRLADLIETIVTAVM